MTVNQLIVDLRKVGYEEITGLPISWLMELIILKVFTIQVLHLLYN